MSAIVRGSIVSRAGVATVVLVIVGAVMVTCIGSCAFVSHKRDKAFGLVQIGDPEKTVLDLFGTQPSVREKPGALFARYASAPCGESCTERLWFENRLSLDTEAWSLELDKDRRVIKKSQWRSP